RSSDLAARRFRRCGRAACGTRCWPVPSCPRYPQAIPPEWFRLPSGYSKTRAFSAESTRISLARSLNSNSPGSRVAPLVEAIRDCSAAARPQCAEAPARQLSRARRAPAARRFRARDLRPAPGRGAPHGARILPAMAERGLLDRGRKLVRTSRRHHRVYHAAAEDRRLIAARVLPKVILSPHFAPIGSR